LIDLLSIDLCQNYILRGVGYLRPGLPLSELPLSDFSLSDLPLTDLPLSDLSLTDLSLSDLSFGFDLVLSKIRKQSAPGNSLKNIMIAKNTGAV
jgi:hypothetical protein